MIAKNRPNINNEGVIKSEDGSHSFMQTFSGTLVNVLVPKEDEINIEDIAIALSKQCRFNGHCSQFYSVAQHCVLGADIFVKMGRKDLAKEFLLHDATEAYVGDVIRPVKRQLKSFGRLENSFWKTISRKYGLPLVHSSEVHDMDNLMAVWEKRDLLPNSSEWPNMPKLDGWDLSKIVGWSPEDAEKMYLRRFKELFNEV